MSNTTKITVRTLANLAALSLRHARMTTLDWRKSQLLVEAAAYIHAAKLVACYAKI
jgi:hypothetical protein